LRAIRESSETSEKRKREMRLERRDARETREKRQGNRERRNFLQGKYALFLASIMFSAIDPHGAALLLIHN